MTLGGSPSTAPVRMTNVRDGRIAQGSTDAVNGGQVWALEQDFNDRWNIINNRMDGLEKRIDAVGAQAASMAMMAGTPVSLGVGQKAIGIGVGMYGNSQAFSVGIKARPTSRLSVSLGASMSSDGKTMIGAGVSLLIP